MAAITASLVSLNAVSATGAGTALDVPKGLEETNNCGLLVKATGSPTNVVVTIEVQDAAGNWLPVNGASLTTTTGAIAGAFTVPPGSAKVRANLTTLTGGTTPTVTATIHLLTDD